MTAFVPRQGFDRHAAWCLDRQAHHPFEGCVLGHEQVGVVQVRALQRGTQRRITMSGSLHRTSPDDVPRLADALLRLSRVERRPAD